MKKYNKLTILATWVLFALLLPFTLVTMSPINDNDDKTKNHIKLKVSAGESHVYEWNVTWGGVGAQEAREIAVDSLNNVYLCGRTDSWGAGGTDAVLVKYNSDGILLWNQTWGGIGSETAMGVAVDSLDNVYITGGTSSFGATQFFLTKYNSAGLFQWNITQGTIDNPMTGMEVAIDSFDNIYVGAILLSATPANIVFLAKYNSAGDQLWNRTWGNEGENPCGLTFDSSGNIYVTGPSWSFTPNGGTVAVFVLKYNTLGVLQWNITWGGTISDWSYDIEIDSSGNIYVTGEKTPPPPSHLQWLLVKFNSTGAPQWNRTWESGRAAGIVLDSSDNIYLSGTSAIGMTLCKFNSDGEQLWNQSGWVGIAGGRYTVPTCANDSLENIYLAGTTVGGNTVLAKFRRREFDDPIIIINSPSYGDEFKDTAPDYDISITEQNMESFWYTIDGGITNYTITQFSGIINQEAWDAASYGSITVEFYAKDLDGNIGYNSVVVQKIEEEEEPPSPKIPSYIISIMLGIILIATTIKIILNRYRIRYV